jgi:hypothetical protein
MNQTMNEQEDIIPLTGSAGVEEIGDLDRQFLMHRLVLVLPKNIRE